MKKVSKPRGLIRLGDAEAYLSPPPLCTKPKSLDLLHSNSVLVCVCALLPSQLFFSSVSTKQKIKCFAQGHNTVALASLKLAALQSQV